MFARLFDCAILGRTTRDRARPEIRERVSRAFVKPFIARICSLKATWHMNISCNHD